MHRVSLLLQYAIIGTNPAKIKRLVHQHSLSLNHMLSLYSVSSHRTALDLHSRLTERVCIFRVQTAGRFQNQYNLFAFPIQIFSPILEHQPPKTRLQTEPSIVYYLLSTSRQLGRSAPTPRPYQANQRRSTFAGSCHQNLAFCMIHC